MDQRSCGSRAAFLARRRRRRGSGGEWGTETEGEPIRTRVASVADRPAKSRESRSRCPGTEGNTENAYESTGRCTSADVHARSERVLGGFDLVRIRAAHYAHIIGPTNRHRSPTIDPGPAGILLRLRRDSAMTAMPT